MSKPYSLRRHCEAIRLGVDAEPAGLQECHCSICARSGFFHWKVPVAAVRLMPPGPTL